MTKLISYADAFASFEAEIKPAIIATYGQDDVALSEGWNDYTDSLCKDGQMNGTMYHYCPAVDDSMPDDSEMAEVLLESMGFTMDVQTINERTDGVSFSRDSYHFALTIKRGTNSMECEYSMGKAYGGRNPELSEVLENLLTDTDSVDSRTFEEWCDDMGLDEDSRKALATYELIQKQAEQLAPFFTKQERADLQEMMADLY
jgi:hypothetical protein